MDETIETREEVAEEATPETPIEEVEQREDDYEGLKRMIEEGFNGIRELIEGISAKIDDADVEIVESGAIITGGDLTEGELEEEIEEDETTSVVEDILSGDTSIEEILAADDEVEEA